MTNKQKISELESKELLLTLKLSKVLADLEKLMHLKEEISAEIEHLHIERVSLGIEKTI